jgi:hypothetical protein
MPPMTRRVGRPPKPDGTKFRQRNVTIEPHLDDQLRAIAAARRVSISMVVGEAVSIYLANLQLRLRGEA